MLAIAVLQFPKFADYATPTVVLCLAAGAFIAYAAGEYFQHRDNKSAQRETKAIRFDLTASHRRYEEMAKNYESLHKRGSAKPVASENVLRDKVITMANELFAFLREKGPQPEIKLTALMDTGDIIEEAFKTNGPYVNAIHHGYMHRFKNRVNDLFSELAENGIGTDLKPWEINPPEVARARTIRKVAEELFLIATRMDIDKASQGT